MQVVTQRGLCDILKSVSNVSDSLNNEGELKGLFLRARQIATNPQFFLREGEKYELMRLLQSRGPLQSCFAARILGANYRYQADHGLLELVWPHLGLKYMEMSEAGTAINTAIDFIIESAPLIPRENVVRKVRGVPFVMVKTSLPEILKSTDASAESVDPVWRSSIYKLKDRPSEVLVIKWKRNNESVVDLIRELQSLLICNHIKLEGKTPKLVYLKDHDDAECVELLDVEGRLAVAFIAPHDYFETMKGEMSQAMTASSFECRLANNLVDVNRLARYGYLHTVPSPLFHMSERPFSWLGPLASLNNLDKFLVYSSGVGRMAGWKNVSKDSNYSVSGLRDYQEIVDSDDRKTLFQRVDIHSVSYAPLWDYPNIDHVLEILFLGLNYVGAAMLAVDFFIQGHFNQTEILLGMTRMLSSLFAHGYAELWSISLEQAEKIIIRRSDWKRVAAQFNYFCIGHDFDKVRPGAFPDLYFNKNLFGEGVQILGQSGRSLLGPYDPDTFDSSFGFYERDSSGDRIISSGPINGPLPIQEILKATAAVFLPP